MAAAATLSEAAVTSYNNLAPLWTANTLKAALASFVSDLLPTFPDEAAGGRPVADWLTVIDALQDDIPAASAPPVVIRTAALYVYKLCWLTSSLATSSAITGLQATAVLNAYNTRF